MIAVVIETAAICPTIRPVDRSAAMAADWSGASCRPAFRLAGEERPVPRPITHADIASHA